MPNTKPPITTTALALAYKDRILAALPAGGPAFDPLMTLYATDQTTADEIRLAKASDAVYAVKLYPAGATTNSESGVTDMSRLAPALEAMEEVRHHPEAFRDDPSPSCRRARFTLVSRHPCWALRWGSRCSCTARSWTLAWTSSTGKRRSSRPSSGPFWRRTPPSRQGPDPYSHPVRPARLVLPALHEIGSLL